MSHLQYSTASLDTYGFSEISVDPEVETGWPRWSMPCTVHIKLPVTSLGGYFHLWWGFIESKRGNCYMSKVVIDNL